MDEHDDTLSGPDQEHQRIPVDLHSVYESGPFTRCTICNCSLHSGRLIGRDVDRGTQAGTVQYGGGQCDNAPGESFPEAAHMEALEGREADADAVYEIQKVFRGSEVLFEMAICRRCGEQVAKEFSEASIDAMKGFLLSNFKPDSEASHCHFCGFPRALLEGWTMVGACKQDLLIFPPIILCEPCSENLQQRLSKKTRDVQDEFIRDHFPGVPADLDFSPSVFGV